jgi:hypothetical protein
MNVCPGEGVALGKPALKTDESRKALLIYYNDIIGETS